MDVINVAKQLIRKKMYLNELEISLTEKESEAADKIMVLSRLHLKKIKKKVKEKSEITKQFKNDLDDAERSNLKSLVKSASQEIKDLESELKAFELELGSIIAKNDVETVPLQFQLPKSNKEIHGTVVFEVLNSNDKWTNKWRCFLDKFSAHSNYHRPEWLNVLHDYSGFELYLFALSVDGELVAGVPALFMKSRLFGEGMVSVPYVNYGGVLSISEDSSIRLLSEIKSWMVGRGVDFFELRMTQPGLAFPVKEQKCSMILNLPESDQKLEDSLGAKVRAQYKKALENDVSVAFGGIELLDEFYYVFCRNMRDLGTPVYSKSLFERILKEESITSSICIVKLDNKPVSVAFLTGYRDVLEIPWASTLRSANKYSVNMYMYRTILKKAIELGYEFFDFGRSTKDSSTYRFKKQWGAKPFEHFWYYLISSGDVPETNPDNPKYRLAISVWQRLPVWLTNIIGPPIVKNIP